MATKPLALGLAIAALLTGTAEAAVTLKIKNQSGQQVWVMWTGTTSLTGSGGAVGAIAPSDKGSNEAGYDVSTFQNVGTNEYQINGFTMNGGRMWFTYGSSSWTFNNAGYTPALATFTDPNFTKRYDKIEASITGSTDDNLDITAVDAYSIPFTVTAYNSQSKATTTQFLNGSIGAVVQGALGAIAANANAPAPVTPAGATPPLTQITGFSPYLYINQNSQGSSTAGAYQNSPIGSVGAFVRIIANDNRVAPLGNDPVAAANGSGVPANYNWTNHDNLVKRMDGRATSPFSGTTTIAGAYAGVKPFSTTLTMPALYNLTATFNPTEVLVADYIVPGTGPGTGPYKLSTTGAGTISGTATIAGAQYTVILKIPYGGAGNYSTPAGFAYPNAFMLDPSGIVGSNANYFYKFYLTSNGDPGYWNQTDPYHGGPQNNLLTWIEGDLFAGMNVGAAGSDKTFTTPITLNGNTYAAGTKVGTFNSQDWFSLGAKLAAAAAAAAGTNAQGSPYDYYFGYLQSDSDFYNKYAETIYPLTDAYGFAYSDRIQGGRVAIAWDATKTATAIDTVEITILPDRGLPFNPGHVHATEYHNQSLDHYFVTHAPDEIAKLDAGTDIKGWRRTGRTIAVYPTARPGTTPVCRYRIPPAQGDSHFLGRDPAECNATAAKHPSFVMESAAFMHMVMPTQGVCPANTSPLYRVFSNRTDANHRYVNDRATRSQMLARGWVAEGDGSDRVTICAPM